MSKFKIQSFGTKSAFEGSSSNNLEQDLNYYRGLASGQNKKIMDVIDIVSASLKYLASRELLYFLE